ncbi:TonB-dependent copper receptor [Luteimonas yindakuii]|uniref:TonB-dependent copper receptor n=1 Tax=Luteimonas yindakuii TaxID=2565782 RepID=UPI0011077880|nr:TonB-dependent copper receptor [Luteimonas yindakuii]
MSTCRSPATPQACLTIAILAVLFAPAALAADVHVHDPMVPVDLDAVVVTAMMPVSPLTFETDPRVPRQPVPASDGADYLKTIPGFAVVRNGGTNGDPVLRGMFGSRLNLLTNDGAMPGACPSRMDNAMSYIAPETYDRLVVVKGPQTVLWGPGASAGTVRFERDREVFDAPTLKFAGSLLGGSAGRNDQVADLTWGSGPGYARASANRSEADDYSDGDGHRVASAWKKWNADLALGWTPDADTLVELSAGVGDGEARYATRGMDGSQFDRENLALRIVKRNLDGPLAEWEASIYSNRADHVMDNYSLRTPVPGGMMPMAMASNVERRTSGGRAAATWRADAWELVAGIDGQDGRHRRRNASGRDAYLAQPWRTDARFANLGVFGEGTWHVDDRNRLVAGARVDRAEATDERATLGTMGMVRPNPTAGVTRAATLPAAFVRYERDVADQPMSWFAGLGHTTRMPDYWELFSPDMGPIGTTNAFAGLATEKTTQLDVGFEYRGKRFNAWASAYAGRIGDYIQFRYVAGAMGRSSSAAHNIDARIHGAELGAEFRPDTQWTFGGSLAHARGEDRDSGRPLPQMPPLEARLTAAWDNGSWSAGMLLRSVAVQERVAPGYGNVVGQDIGTSPGFATLAVNAGYRLGSTMRVSAGIDNLFDRAYSEHLNLAGNADFGYPADAVRINEPGRTAWVKLNVSY